METPIPNQPPPQPAPNTWNSVRKILYILGTLVLFVFALDLMVSSLQHLGKTAAETIIMATSNPFTGLFIGLLITAMIQSSSTTTALVVAMVASGSLTLESAIPIIMGANIGTTITSTIVALGFINKRKEFRRAVAAGTYHDFFNILTATILFPLEYYYGFLSQLSEWITSRFITVKPEVSSGTFSPVWSGFSPVIDFLMNVIPNAFVLAIFSFALLFTSILLFRRLISNWLMASSPERFSRFFFKNTWKSFFWGLVTTATIRSSTITTSVVVPIVAQKITSLRKAAPFILGANIGTTITAFIAATLNTDSSSAISIAMAHFLFNFIGVLVFFPIPILRRIPLGLANGLGRLTLKYRLAGFVYILMTFFFIPFSLIYLNKDSLEVLDLTYQKTDHLTGEHSTYRIVSKTNVNIRNGEWLIYRGSNIEPDEIFPVYLKNNILFINKEMLLFNEPGFCWDGESSEGKYRRCIRDVLSSYELGPGLKFDSVYVYTQQFYHQPDSILQRIYVSVYYPVILKHTVEQGNTVIETRQITSLERK